MSSIQKPYDTDTDILKILSALFVIMIHAASNLYGHIFFNSLARFSVPIFVLISGHYMLFQRENLISIWKRCIRILMTMFVWSGLFLLYQLFAEHLRLENGMSLIKYLLTEPSHLWYCYAIFALYLFTPIFSVFCHSANRRELEYALALTFFFGSIVNLLLRCGMFPMLSIILDRMKLDSTLGFVFLYLAGYYLRVYDLSLPCRKCFYALGILGFSVTYFGTVLRSSRVGVLDELFFSFFSPNVIASSLAIYILIRYRQRIRPFRDTNGRIHRLASCSAGIYFLHPMIILLFQDFLTEPWLHWPVAIPLRTLIFFVISFIIVWILKKIPILRELV